MGAGMKRREYKRTHDSVTKNLKLHANRMKELMEQGMEKDEASKQAYREIMEGKLK